MSGNVRVFVAERGFLGTGEIKFRPEITIGNFLFFPHLLRSSSIGCMTKPEAIRFAQEVADELGVEPEFPESFGTLKSKKAKKYRVLSSRPDVEEDEAGSFEAYDDQEASIIFRERFKNNPEYAWDYLRLIRIAQEEVSVQLEVNKKA